MQKAVEINALQVLPDLLHFQLVLFYAAFVTSLILPTMLPDFETSCGGGDECLSSYPSYFILKSWDFETLRLGGYIQLVFVFIPPRAAFPAQEHTHMWKLSEALLNTSNRERYNSKT